MPFLSRSSGHRLHRRMFSRGSILPRELSWLRPLRHMYELSFDFDRLVFLQRPELWLEFTVLRSTAPATTAAARMLCGLRTLRR